MTCKNKEKERQTDREIMTCKDKVEKLKDLEISFYNEKEEEGEIRKV